jgi:SpoVK/Ycf46/Vps4 family AAA+-type ATPase
MRAALALADTIQRCVLWLDEIEKAFAGVSSGHDGDSGVGKRVFGTFLTWLQEHTTPVFVFATANDVSKLPPELLRKGRFDVIFAADLPTVVERQAILKITLRKVGRELSDSDIARVAQTCTRDGFDFAGVEVASLVRDGLARAFMDGKRELRADDLIAAAQSVVPLAKSSEPQIKTLREWASKNARPASRGMATAKVSAAGSSVVSKLDIE